MAYKVLNSHCFEPSNEEETRKNPDVSAPIGSPTHVNHRIMTMKSIRVDAVKGNINHDIIKRLGMMN